MVLWFTGRSLVLAGKKYTNTIYITPVGLTTTDRIYENSLVSVNQPIAASKKTIVSITYLFGMHIVARHFASRTRPVIRV